MAVELPPWVTARLKECAEFGEGWDDDGSAKVSESALEWAEKLLATLHSHGITLNEAFLCPTGDGGLDISWNNYGLFIEVTGSQFKLIQHDRDCPSPLTCTTADMDCNPWSITALCEYVRSALVDK